MKSLVAALLICVLALSGCSAQQKAQDISNVIAGILNIGQAEESALPPADAAIITPWVSLGLSLDGQLNTCIGNGGVLAKKATFLACFNTFAGGLLSPAELAQLRILSPNSQSKVQLWATAVILGVNTALTSFGGASQPLPVVAASPAKTSQLNDLRQQLQAQGL